MLLHIILDSAAIFGDGYSSRPRGGTFTLLFQKVNK